MFLKSLDIFGFKSFADRTHIDFSDGITALLGPNGCGKSNVVDSIKWVLAENKSKNLRADKMEDVIFNGTERRPPLNVAEVTLTIMNENGLLPLEEPEIAIKRRLYRSGESEYFINNRSAGPKEIRSLFMDTGIGKAAYSVMEQGKIDQILSSKPEDRRYLFEEAAGISRSKAECAEAERELERTRVNMQQIEVALAEIKRSYDTLKIQADKTTKYRSVKDEIFNEELDLTLLKLKNFVQDKAHNEEELKLIEKKRDQVRNEIDEINNTLSENMDKVKAMQEQVYAKQADLIGIQKEKSGKQDLVKQFNVRASEIKEKIGQLEAHKKAIQEQIDSLTEEIDDQEAQLHEKTKQLADIQKNITSFQGNIESAGSQITENDRQADEAKKQIEVLNNERSKLQKDLAAITEDIVTMLDAKLKDAGFSESAMANAKETLDNILSRLKVFTEGRKNIFSDFAANSSHSPEDCVKTVKEAADAFSETGKLVDQLQTALSDYLKASPAFITEFLAPEGIMTKKRTIDSKIQETITHIASINSHIEELHAVNTGLSEKINEYKETLGRLRINEVQMKEQISAAEQQASILRRSLTSQQNTLRDTDDELVNENKHAEALDDQIEGVQDELAEIEQKGLALADALKELDENIAKCNSSVSGKQSALRKKQEEQNKCQGQYEKLTLSLASSDTEIRNVKQNFQDTHSRDLMEFEERMYKIIMPAADIRERLLTAKDRLRDLGQVNLMAPEEFAEVKERYERQQTNYEDTKKSLENLQRVSEEIRSKSSEMFLDTYNKIKKNFHNMFRRLFNGGRGELRLEDPENVLTSGIDIFAQPPGKKLENIALLSGGEKTMTAVALLFATYQVRPSPFCLLDEIDAALDDKNVSSFVTTLRSFANVSQYIVITHNKKTVMGASTMLGITMEESGVSKILALRLDKDIKLGATVPEPDNKFVEEDVAPETAVIPPRPAKRIHNPDGSVTDPERQKQIQTEKELEKEAAAKVKPAEKGEQPDNAGTGSNEDDSRKY
ncbi:MAG: AAA family ATPase [Treponema sp.]|nr:AAA family ATPase [Treponema sp.]